jgi:Icc-related predicted phosphoesterase
MLLIGLTDIHGKPGNIDKLGNQLKEADVVLISGDITHFGGEKDTIRIIENVKKYNSDIFAVSGNCDYPEVESYLTRAGYGINGTSISFKGILITGLGGSLPCPGRTPNEYPDSELKQLLAESVSDRPENSDLILVSHQPPVNTLNDEVSKGIHVGSNAVRSFIEEYQPLICFTGHIHEGVGIDVIGKTKIINPGPLWHGKFAYARISDSNVTKLDIVKV